MRCQRNIKLNIKTLARNMKGFYCVQCADVVLWVVTLYGIADGY